MGKLYSWGNNTDGQAGDGYAARKLSPTQTITEGDWEDIQVGADFAIALKDGRLYSWGFGASYQTGQNNTTDLAIPTQVGSATNWESFSAASGYYCLAIQTDGTLWAWGANNNGRTGRGLNSGNTENPTQVGSASDWSKVSAGHFHSLAIKDDGTLWSWGEASNGKLGNGTTTPEVLSPTQIGSDTNWAEVSSGRNYSLAVKTDGTLWAWGGNSSSQLGTGNTTEYTTPTQVGTDTNWSKVEASKNTSFWCSFAIKTTGSLWSWGANLYGQTARGTTSGTQTTPAQVGSDTDWTLVRFGGFNNGIAIKGGKLYGWGRDATQTTNASSGDGTGIQRTSPVEIDSNATWTTASILNQAFALRGGNLYFWGFNANGVSGEGRLLNYTTSPAQIGSGTDWESLGQGNELHVMAIKDGKLFGTGNQRNGALGNNVDQQYVRQYSFLQSGSDTGWTQVATSGRGGVDSDSHSLGIRNGELYAWGHNAFRQLGDGTTTNRIVPTKIGAASDWTMVSAGRYFSVGIRDGKLFSWGLNQTGRTGQGTTSGNTNSPTQIGSDSDWVFVDAGTEHALAIKSNGTLWGWGRNDQAQLGDGSQAERTSPVQIGNATNWAWVNTGNIHSHGITTDGKLYSWGNGANGRLANGTTSGIVNTPTQVGSDTNWLKVSAGHFSSLAIRTTGTLWAWGRNNEGNLGDGTTTQRTVPTQIGSGDKWADVAVVDLTSFAIESVNVPPANTAVPTVSGTAKVGQTLTTTDGTWNGTPTPTYAYKWQVSDDGSTGWSDISGATSSTFTITSSEAGKYIRSEVTATNSEGSAAEPSAATSQVLEDPAVSTPIISGTAKVGETLTASASATAGVPSPSITYAWESSPDGSTWTAISGGTSSTLLLDSSLAGLYIRVEATATNSEGTDSDVSTATAQVTQDPVVDTPFVSGQTKVGQTLTATANATEGFPAPSISFIWKRADTSGGSYSNISGATSSTYVLQSADLGKFIKVQATASNSEGSDSQLSAAIGPITEDTPPPPPPPSGGQVKATGAIIGALGVIRRI